MCFELDFTRTFQGTQTAKKGFIVSSISAKKRPKDLEKLMQALNVRYAECTAVN